MGKIRRSKLDLFKSLTEDQCYEIESGGFWFSIMQFEGVQSVKQVLTWWSSTFATWRLAFRRRPTA